MRDAILIQDLSVAELRELFQAVIQRENTELRGEVAMLREELRTNRSVLTLKAATHFFDHLVTPATIIDYISYCGLPAFKKGRLWFVYLRDLLDWQIGLIGYPSTKHLGKKNVVAPRHQLRIKRTAETERSRTDRHRSPGSDGTSGLNSSGNKTGSRSDV